MIKSQSDIRDEWWHSLSWSYNKQAKWHNLISGFHYHFIFHLFSHLTVHMFNKNYQYLFHFTTYSAQNKASASWLRICSLSERKQWKLQEDKFRQRRFSEWSISEISTDCAVNTGYKRTGSQWTRWKNLCSLNPSLLSKSNLDNKSTWKDLVKVYCNLCIVLVGAQCRWDSKILVIVSVKVCCCLGNAEKTEAN